MYATDFLSHFPGASFQIFGCHSYQVMEAGEGWVKDESMNGQGAKRFSSAAESVCGEESKVNNMGGLGLATAISE